VIVQKFQDGGILLSGFGSNTGTTLFQVVSGLQAGFTAAPAGAFQVVSLIFGGLLSFVLIVVLSFYFAVQDTGIDDFLRLITPIKKHRYVLDLWRRSQHKIGRWMQGQLLLSLMAGTLVWVGLALLGVPYAFLLGALAAVLELIPVFGSILAAVPAVAIAFSVGGASFALMVIALYIVVNQFQANLVYPLVVQKVVGVPPLLVILALIVGAQIAGFLGIILSVPVAAALREFIVDVQKGKQKLLEEHEASLST
jgi:predicted PurR-regulated permease PerM